MRIPKTQHRVAEQTQQEINERIQSQTRLNITAYAAAGNAAIEQRLKQLDEEWDIERVLETNGSAILLFGLFMSVFNRRWLILPAAVGGFCLQHAIQGWCPPIEAFRRLGVRTAKEINEERMALKALRGDFEDLPLDANSKESVDGVIKAVQK